MKVGVDIVENGRVIKLYKLQGEKFLDKFLTREEIKVWTRRGAGTRSLCGIFAAKEAVIKAMGPGGKINLKQVRIIYKNDKAPTAVIIKSGVKVAVSISHETRYSVAIAICG